MVRTTALPILAWSSPGSTRTAPTVGHQDRGEKYTTGKFCRFRTRDNLVVGNWNVQTLTADGKLEELANEMDQYYWNIIGISELRWKAIGETSTDVGHKLYISGKEDKNQHWVSFLVHKDTMDTLMGCRPVSSSLITICMRATPFNITIIQVNDPTSMCEDSEVEYFLRSIASSPR